MAAVTGTGAGVFPALTGVGIGSILPDAIFTLKNDQVAFHFVADATTGARLVQFTRKPTLTHWINSVAELWRAEVFDTTAGSPFPTATVTPTLASIRPMSVTRHDGGQRLVISWTDLLVGGVDRLSVTMTFELRNGEDWLRAQIFAHWSGVVTKYAIDSITPLPLLLPPLQRPNDCAVLPTVFGILSRDPVAHLRYNPVGGEPFFGFGLLTTNTWEYPSGRGWSMGFWGYYDTVSLEAWMAWVEDWSLEVMSVTFESTGSLLKWEARQPQQDSVLVANNGRFLGSGYTFCLRPMLCTQFHGWWDIGRQYRARLEALRPEFYVEKRVHRTDISSLEKNYSIFIDLLFDDSTGPGKPGDFESILEAVRENCGAPPGTPIAGVIEADSYALEHVGEADATGLRARLAAESADGASNFGLWHIQYFGPQLWDTARWHQSLGDSAEYRWWTNNDMVGSLRMSRTGRLEGGGNDRLWEQDSGYYRERIYPVVSWDGGTKTLTVTGTPSADGFTGTLRAVIIPASSTARLASAEVVSLGAASVTVASDFLDGLGAVVTPDATMTVAVLRLLGLPSGPCFHAQVNSSSHMTQLANNSTLGLWDSWAACGRYFDVFSEPLLALQHSGATLCYRDHSTWSKINGGYVRHPYGAGSWHKLALRSLLGALKESVRTAQVAAGRTPFFWLSCEDIDETAQDRFDFVFHGVSAGRLWRNTTGFDPAIHRYLTIPLYAVVHGGKMMGRSLLQEFSTAILDPNLPFFNDPGLLAFQGYVLASEWVYGLTFPTLSLYEDDVVSLKNPWDESLYQPAGPASPVARSLRDMWVQIITAESGGLLKYLRYGDFHAPAVLDVAGTDFTTGLAQGPFANDYFSYDTLYDRFAYPRVVHGVWKASDGGVCVALANWTDTAAKWSGTLDTATLGLGAPGSAESERITFRRVDASARAVGDVTFDPSTGKLSLASVPALTITVVVLENTALPQDVVLRLMPQYTPVRQRPVGGINLNPPETIGLGEAVVANNVEHANGTLAKRRGYKNVLTGSADLVLKGGAPAQSIRVVGEEWWLHRPIELTTALMEPSAIDLPRTGRRDFFHERPSIIVIPVGTAASGQALALDVRDGDPDWAIEFCFKAEMLPIIHGYSGSLASPILKPIVVQKGQQNVGQWALRLIPDPTSTDRLLAVLTLYEGAVLGTAGVPAGVDFFYSSGANRAWIEPGKRVWVAWKYTDGGSPTITSYYWIEGAASVVSSSQAVGGTLRINGVTTVEYPLTVGRRPYQAAGRAGIAAVAPVNDKVIDEMGFVGSVSEIRFWLETAQGGATTLELPSNWATVTSSPPAATDWYVEREIEDEQLTLDASVLSSSIARNFDLERYYSFKPELIGANPDGSTNAGENHRFIRPRFLRNGSASDLKAWITGADATWVPTSGVLGSYSLGFIPAGPAAQDTIFSEVMRSGDTDSRYGQRLFCGGVRIPNALAYVNRSTSSSGTGFQFPSEMSLRFAFRADSIPAVTSIQRTLAELSVVRQGGAGTEDRYAVLPIMRVAIVHDGVNWVLRFTMSDGAGVLTNLDSTTTMVGGSTHVVIAAVKFDSAGASNRVMSLFLNGVREATNSAVASKPWMSQTTASDNVSPNLDTEDGRDSCFQFTLGYSVTTPAATRPDPWAFRFGSWGVDSIGILGAERPYWAFNTNDTVKGVNDGVGYRGHNPFVGLIGSVQAWHRYVGESEARELATRDPSPEEMQRDGAAMLSSWDFEEGQGCCAFDRGYLKNHLRINPFPTGGVMAGALDRVNRPPLLSLWQKRQASTSGLTTQSVYGISNGVILKVDGSGASRYLRPIGACATPDEWQQATTSWRLPTAFQFGDAVYVCTGFGAVKRILNDKVADAGISPMYGDIGDDQTNPGWREFDRDGTFAITAVFEGANPPFPNGKKFGWIVTPYDSETGIEGAPSRPTFITPYDIGGGGDPGWTAVWLAYVPRPVQRQVSHVNVYRTTANGGIFKFIGRIPNNQVGDEVSNAIFTDSTTDLKLGSELTSWLNYPPPQHARIGLAFGTRALYFGVDGAPDTLYYSLSDQPGACPKAYQIRVTSGQSTELTGGVVLNGRAFIFTRTATYSVFDAGGDISIAEQSLPPVQIESLRDDLGCISHHSIVVVEGVGAVIPTERGLYLFDGVNFRPIFGRPIDRVMRFWETLKMAASRNFVAVAHRRKQQYILFCSTITSPNSANDRAIVWDWGRNAITFQTNRDVLSASTIADPTTGQERTWCTTIQGNVFEFDPPDQNVDADGVVAAPYSGTVQDVGLSPFSAVYSRLKLVTNSSLPVVGDGLRGVNLYITNGAGSPWSVNSLPLKILWNDENWVLVDYSRAAASSPAGFEWRLGAIASDWQSGRYGDEVRNMRVLRHQAKFNPSTGTTLLAEVGYDGMPATTRTLDPTLDRGIVAGVLGRGKRFRYRFYDSPLYGGLPNNHWEVTRIETDVQPRGRGSYVAT